LGVLVAVLGALAAGAVVRTLLRDDARGLGASWPAALATAAAVLGLVAFGSSAWTQGRAYLNERKVNVDVTPAAARAAGGGPFPAREDILKVVDEQIPKDDTVFLECRDPACGGGLNLWITYRLAPRIFTGTPREADWVLLYNATPAQAGLRSSDLVDPVEIADRYVIARVR
jgi:hypothetical protein